MQKRPERRLPVGEQLIEGNMMGRLPGSNTHPCRTHLSLFVREFIEACARRPLGVVLFAFFLATQYLVGFAHLQEVLLSLLLVIGILVWMILPSQDSVRLQVGWHPR